LQELEEFVVQKLCEAVTERCELGSVRQRCQLLEQMVYQWRKRAQQLQKQVINLLKVLSLYKNIPAKIASSD
jgi:16S rRNA G1207 methylase RsmC